MTYNLDLECLSVQEYRELLKKQNLLPGHIQGLFCVQSDEVR
jgi:hypothetical protein